MSGSDDDDGDEHDELDSLMSSGLDTDMETAFSIYDLDKSSDAESIQSGDNDKSSGSLSDCSCDSDNHFAMDSIASDTFREMAVQLVSRRYLTQRVKIVKSTHNLDVILTEYKANRPDLFRRSLRMYPQTFDLFVERLSSTDVFSNMTARQVSVERQLAVTLYRFGHYGNGASMFEVSIWSGMGVGTIVNCTKRVLSAIFTSGLEQEAIRWPSPAEREKYKQYVEEISCPAWRNGWCMIDGTLVPLYAKPYFYGDMFFDRKSNYSLNVQ
ncbi:hypothetical protein V1527DRAFT_448128, partial [Lipomyces starkeyi]